MTEGAGEQGEEDQNRLSPAADLDELSGAERKSIERQSRPSAALIHETIRAEGISEIQRSAAALLLSGFAAGLSMGFCLLCEAMLRARLPEAPWADLISRLGYSVGFLIVVLGRQQLFTENTLTPVLPLLHERRTDLLIGLLRLWSLVLLANVAGAWCVAAAFAKTQLLEPPVAAAAREIARHALDHPPLDILLRGIFAGWLIALMVWLLPAARASRPTLIFLLTYVVALGGFSHVIAGSVDVLYLHHLGQVTWSEFALHFFLPALVGNTAGGVMLVAVLNYGQVAEEIDE